jgi:hypothetical protein
MPGLPSSCRYDEGSSAPEGATKDNPAPMVLPRMTQPPRVPSSTASMDVHVGSPPVQSEEPVLTSLPFALVGPITLEVSDPGAGNLLQCCLGREL